LIAIGISCFVAMLMLRRPRAAAVEDADDDAGEAPDLDELRGDAAAA
jgi:hypothetical protein